jgi:hypothetical protein
MCLYSFGVGFFSILFQVRSLYVVCNFMRHTMMMMVIMVMSNKLTNSVFRVFFEQLVCTRATEKFIAFVEFKIC